MIISHKEAPLILQGKMGWEAVCIKFRNYFLLQFLIINLLTIIQLL